MRKKAFIVNNIFFYFIIISILSLTKDISLHKDFIQDVGLIWVLLIIIVALSNNMLFSDDQEKGIIEQLLMSYIPFPLIIFIKIFVYWVGVILPLMIISPIIMVFLYIPIKYMGIILLTLLLSSPSIVWVIGIVSALTLNLKYNGLFLIILVMPLLIPLIMTAIGVVNLAYTGEEYIVPLSFLAASLVLTTTCVPFVIAYILSITTEP